MLPNGGMEIHQKPNGARTVLLGLCGAAIIGGLVGAALGAITIGMAIAAIGAVGLIVVSPH